MDGGLMMHPALEREIALAIDLAEELDHLTPCEGPSHPAGKHGHDPSQPAGWMLVLTCGHEWLACDAWLKAADHESGGADWWYFECQCGKVTNGDELVRIKLP